MVVVAHPDDMEFYCGGTIAKLAQAGNEVTVVVCTEGDKGTFDLQADPDELAAIRKEEQEEAAKLLGIKGVIYLGYADGELEANPTIKQELAGLYRQYQPQVLFTFDPWKRYELHPDHLAAGQVALEARLAAKLPLYYPEQLTGGLAPCEITQIYLFNTDSPNYWEDITKTFDLRLQALFLHRSQFAAWEESVRKHIEAEAREAGRAIKKATYAEAFRRIAIEGLLAMAE
jgi:LmbE family N-acetylglucosaminyl deacetylase